MKYWNVRLRQLTFDAKNSFGECEIEVLSDELSGKFAGKGTYHRCSTRQDFGPEWRTGELRDDFGNYPVVIFENGTGYAPPPGEFYSERRPEA